MNFPSGNLKSGKWRSIIIFRVLQPFLMKRRSVPGEGEALNMDIYILLSILVSALFFFTNFFSWGYNLALSLLILFLFLLRLAPAWRLGFLKNVAAISTA